MSFIVSGFRGGEQSYNDTTSSIMASLALLTGLPFVISVAFHLLSEHPETGRETKAFRETSIVMAVTFLVIFLLWMLFRYRTHRYLYDDETDGETESAYGASNIEISGENFLKITGRLTLLLLAIAGSIACSSFLVTSMHDAPDVASSFIQAILIPIATSFSNIEKTIGVAWVGNTDLAVALTLGTSVEISLFALPVLILVGNALGRSFLLDFQLFDTIVLLLASYVAGLLIINGKSNWFDGAMAVAL